MARSMLRRNDGLGIIIALFDHYTFRYDWGKHRLRDFG